MTQLIADVQRMDEERLRRRRLEKQIRLGMELFRDPPFALPDAHDGHACGYDAADAQADQTAAMRGNPFAAWMGASPGLDIAEFAMPPGWARDEYEYEYEYVAPPRYRAP